MTDDLYTALLIGPLGPRLDLSLRGTAVACVLGHHPTWPTLWASDPDLVVLAGYTGKVPADIADAYQVIGRGLTLPELAEAVKGCAHGTYVPPRLPNPELLDADAQANLDPQGAATSY